ncbi:MULTISPECIES: response regulator transcription factor [unclassified Herbaspirillum]|uniref:response regulator transcription factor n=1 Tax=unclassified Herbaspirillum TaxID=2624150 RepID=UPI000E2E4D34|nr:MULTISPECIES: response regulator transcription factor [unclassified Herbaspirillum]RFB74321.1 DNA-binding response regulator [Herbaspirillum sp. 3R-3a1]TFI11463.1 response regulator transcription factor [Herbaspirillum sp. 3R11]TFI17371.1 response regulator transcription factor [Herbaspirillum sp. 3R-11]TFI21494.1 response regulator transcription factor [Herbaspirillum sp. 3C11]
MTWTATKAIRIALLDDHAVVRHGLAARLTEESDFEVVGAYAASKDMMSALRALPADILLIDYSLGANDIDGLNLIRALKVRFPDSKILVSSSHYNPATVALAMRAGARGFVGKEQELSELIAAVRSVAVGRVHLNPLMAAEISSMLSSNGSDEESANGDSLTDNVELSPREREVLRCCLDGLSVTQIAEKFARSVKTISGQKQAAFRKLGVRNDNELFKIQHQLQDI